METENLADEFSPLKYVCFDAGIYLLKVNNKFFRTRCEIYKKLTIKATEWRQ